MLVGNMEEYVHGELNPTGVFSSGSCTIFVCFSTVHQFQKGRHPGDQGHSLQPHCPLTSTLLPVVSGGGVTPKKWPPGDTQGQLCPCKDPA